MATCDTTCQIASCDVKPTQLNYARRPRVDVEHAPSARRAGLCVQNYRPWNQRLNRHAPCHDQLGAEVVSAGCKENVADACVGECTGQVGDGAHRGLQLTAVAGHSGLRGDATDDEHEGAQHHRRRGDDALDGDSLRMWNASDS